VELEIAAAYAMDSGFSAWGINKYLEVWLRYLRSTYGPSDSDQPNHEGRSGDDATHAGLHY